MKFLKTLFLIAVILIGAFFAIICFGMLWLGDLQGSDYYVTLVVMVAGGWTAVLVSNYVKQDLEG